MGFQIEVQERGAAVQGEAAGAEGEALAEELLALPGALRALPGALRALPGVGELILDLEDLDLEDGVAVAHLVTGLRALRARCDRLVLVGAPQMLAHTLYKVGALSDPGLSLVDPRQDEGMGAG